MSYSAIVGKIQVKPLPDCNNIKLGLIYDTQVIVGKDINDGEMVIFFPPDGCLSEAFLKVNDLVALHDPVTGEKLNRGYFQPSGRVKAIKMRGIQSGGFVAPLEFLLSTPGVKEKHVLSLKEGDQFTSLSGVEICKKYETRATLAARQKKSKRERYNNIRFPQHFDTKQLKYEASKIPPGSLIYLTSKMHGTSGRYTYTSCDVPLTKWQRFKKWLGIKNIHRSKEYKHLVGSRTVILTGKEGGFYGNNDFRYDVFLPFKNFLKKGEIIYGEIVGYLPSGKSIMPPVSTSYVKDKKFTKKYGKQMVYKYGCPKETFDFYVYRIAHTNDDGYVIDLPWPQVKERCKQLELKHVPELQEEPIFYKEGTPQEKEALLKKVEELVDGPDPVDPSHIREGVVLRIESPTGTYFLKHKSWAFLVMEGVIKDRDDNVDIEESS